MSALAAGTVELVQRAAPRSTPAVVPLDPDSREWLRSLRADGAVRDAAIARLHALLLRAARFEVRRRRPTLPHLRGDELDDIATEAAHDALMSVLKRLDDFRGASRFTTWVYKFALLEAAVKLRKRACKAGRCRSSRRAGACSRAKVSNLEPRSNRASCCRR